MIDQADVVVIGSGAFGASAAFHLAKLGKRNVVLLDRFELAAQTSPRAAGLTSMVRGTDVLTRLAQRSVQKLKGFSEETGQPLRFDQSGALKIARTEAHVAQLQQEVARAKSVGVPNEFISTTEAQRLMPFLQDKGILAITYNPTDCNVEPSQVPIGYCLAAQELGVTALPRTPATAIEIGPAGVERVITPRGAIRTEHVVDAAGAWSRLVAELLGVRLPIVPTRHQLLITEPIPGSTPRLPITRVIDANVYIRHEQGGLLLGGYESNPRQLDMRQLDDSFQIDDLELDIDVLWELARTVRDQFPIFDEPSIRVKTHRGGLPTMSPDDRYIFGPVPGVRGFWLMTACCVGGLSISPALGEALARWIVDGQPGLDLSEISLERFAAREIPEDELRERCRRAYAHHYTAFFGGTVP